MKQVQVSEEFQVPWSNGAGYSVYRVVDNPEDGPHLLEVVAEFEYANNEVVPLVR